MSLEWNSYSDQPKRIHDKILKTRMYKAAIPDFFKMLGTNLIIFPVAFLHFLIFPAKKQPTDTRQFFGLSINLDKNPEQTRPLIDELNVANLLIRIPLHDIDSLQNYVDFSYKYKDKDILINILQDRRHIEDPTLLRQSLDKIFQAFRPLTKRFQIGNAINRKKWAFFSMDEYLCFYKVANDLKIEKYPELVLIGSSVIDFEYYFSIRTLFNGYKIHYDQFSSLLYVDRRGAPENNQMGFNIKRKLSLLQSIIRLSNKSSPDIVITETNWPITKTFPYAPTNEFACVSLEEHANYLVRYFLLVLATGAVKKVYWHQLIAPGYGLIDNRDEKLVKYPAFHAFKTMLSLLQGSKFIRYENQSSFHQMHFQGNQNFTVCWSLRDKKIDTSSKKIILRNGETISSDSLVIGESPVYILS